MGVGVEVRPGIGETTEREKWMKSDRKPWKESRASCKVFQRQLGNFLLVERMKRTAGRLERASGVRSLTS